MHIGQTRVQNQKLPQCRLSSGPGPRQTQWGRPPMGRARFREPTPRTEKSSARGFLPRSRPDHCLVLQDPANSFSLLGTHRRNRVGTAHRRPFCYRKGNSWWAMPTLRTPGGRCPPYGRFAVLSDRSVDCAGEEPSGSCAEYVQRKDAFSNCKLGGGRRVAGAQRRDARRRGRGPGGRRRRGDRGHVHRARCPPGHRTGGRPAGR